jgi:hypothetical protein
LSHIPSPSLSFSSMCLEVLLPTLCCPVCTLGSHCSLAWVPLWPGITDGY